MPRGTTNIVTYIYTYICNLLAGVERPKPLQRITGHCHLGHRFIRGLISSAGLRDSLVPRASPVCPRCAILDSCVHSALCARGYYDHLGGTDRTTVVGSHLLRNHGVLWRFYRALHQGRECPTGTSEAVAAEDQGLNFRTNETVNKMEHYSDSL